MAYIVRDAEPTDTLKIAEFQIAMALETENKNLDPETVQKGVAGVFENESRGRYLVCETEGEVVASLLITYEWSDWRNSNMWYIQSVFVQAEHRRQGIFKRLYQSVREDAERNGVRQVRLYVETENEAAQKTYEGIGMKRLPYFMYAEDITG